MNQLFVDNLTVIDFAYLDRQRGLVGESWIVDVVLGGELDEQGMVFDFSNVKRTIKRVIDERVDHRLVIPARYQGLSQSEDTPGQFRWHLTDGTHIDHRSPSEAVVWLESDRVVPSVVAGLLEKELQAVLPANVSSVEISLREEEIDGAYYHYVHGLKKHLGNCQRIAHGHRSRLQIWLNDQRNAQLEQQWAERWADIYLATEEDTIALNDGQYEFAYTARQGEFRLSMPASRCYLMNTDTTVEFIADHLAAEIHQQHPQASVKVKAFEGVNKGAIALR